MELYRHSTGWGISENRSLNMYLGKLIIPQNPFKPKLTAVLQNLVLYFRVALKPVSLSITVCGILDVSSRSSCCGGVGLWALWELGVCLSCQSRLGWTPLPETGMEPRMLCLPHHLRVSSSLPLRFRCKTLPWQEPTADTGAAAAVLCSSLPVRAKWLSRAWFQETSLQIPLKASRFRNSISKSEESSLWFSEVWSRPKVT